MKIGSIGCGNMATAMLTGILREGLVKAEDVLASDPSAEARARFSEALGVRVTEDNREAAAFADVLILAVKPNCVETVAKEIADALRGDAILVTLAAGKSIAWIEGLFPKPVKIVRLMPNTPALVGEGMTGYSTNAQVTPDEAETVRKLLASFGRAEQVDEELLDAVMGVAGSAPAYAFLFIDAIARAGEAAGLTREQALTFAAQTMRGSAKMILETDTDPQELTRRVCSPGGTTIEAVRVFGERDLEGIVAEAIRACIDKAKVL